MFQCWNRSRSFGNDILLKSALYGVSVVDLEEHANRRLSFPSHDKVAIIEAGSNEKQSQRNTKITRIQRDLAENRRRLETSPLNYQFGEFTLDIGRGCVLKAGQEIKLRPKVYETLKYLVEHPGRLIGKQELIQAVWADAFVTDDFLVQCTVELRRALDDRAQHLLKTVPRRGYIFSANVVRCPPDAEPVAAPDYFDLPQDQFKSCLKNPTQTPRPARPADIVCGQGAPGRRGHRVAATSESSPPDNDRTGRLRKTRLAVAVATAVEQTFVGGIQFVGLSSITDPGLVTAALAKAFELQPTTNLTVRS